MILRSLLFVIVLYTQTLLAQGQQNLWDSSSLDGYYSQALLTLATQSRSEMKLKANLERLEKLKVLKRSCDIQVEQNLLPTACFKARKMARQAARYIKTHYYTVLNSINVEKICLRVAKSTKQLSLALLNEVDKKCASVARNQIKLNLYKNGMIVE